MALIIFPFSLGPPWYADDDLAVTGSSRVFFSLGYSADAPATAGLRPSSTAIPLMALPEFSLAWVIPLMTRCRPPTAFLHSRHYLSSASVIPLMTSRLFLLVTFLLATSS